MDPPLLVTGQVKYEKDLDGNPLPEPTVDQMAHDVSAFLQWAAEPELEERRRLGIKVMIYLAILTLLLYFVMKRIWRKLH